MFSLEQKMPDTAADLIGATLAEFQCLSSWTSEKRRLREELRPMLDRHGYCSFRGAASRYNLSRIGDACQYEVSRSRMGHLRPYRGQRVRIVCVAQFGNFDRQFMAGAIDRELPPRPDPEQPVARRAPSNPFGDAPVQPAGPVPDNGMGRYPFIVVRLAGGVYQAEKVEVRRGALAVKVGHRKSFLCHPAPLRPDHQLCDEAKTLLLNEVLVAVRRTGFRMCVVWGPAWCTFVEPDGALNNSFDPPSGGFPLPAPLQFDQ